MDGPRNLVVLVTLRPARRIVNGYYLRSTRVSYAPRGVLALALALALALVDIAVRVDGLARPLPALVELSAYRIVQEALTNVLKHTVHAPATVVVSYGPHRVAVRRRA